MPLTFDDTQSAQLLQAIGLPEDTTDLDLVQAAVADMAKASGGDPVAAAKRAGLATIDPESLVQLRADAQRGRDIAAAAAQHEIEEKVEKAIHAGKIPVSRRKHWVQLIGADKGMADVLASMPDNLIPMEEIGHGVGVMEGDQLAERADWFH
ncbi:hypothetical protein MAAFP003_2374 [Mycobacterium ahvazicum]|uniref:Mu-like prophage I protein n=1 Tax=Mycobacterium ahvazicum TaxID=1964395 RepID=A0A2K4YA98_9MYCO|nr:hypothetical protein [Mycobacterium ahvazicum]SOX53700.1 hypothetical protein MAAFP003_2374 [Mycobacterium ahvazicum]